MKTSRRQAPSFITLASKLCHHLGPLQTRYASPEVLSITQTTVPNNISCCHVGSWLSNAVNSIF